MKRIKSNGLCCQHSNVDSLTNYPNIPPSWRGDNCLSYLPREVGGKDLSGATAAEKGPTSPISTLPVAVASITDLDCP
jgi:hypothetical protein